MPNLLLIGRVGGAHGVRGEVRISTYTADPLAIADYKTLRKADGSLALTVLSARASKGGVVARCKGVETREEAEALRGLTLHIDRADLPEPDEDEFYLADLIGLSAVTPEGEELGRVKSVQDFGAGDILEIDPAAGGPTWYLAFTRETAPIVDIAGGRIVVVRPTEIEARPDDAEEG
ncbi:MAG TPA: ribosome maturation factor RimM [Caulobacter sp.]|nr:ribosome maturation factor RimM [Caulobacter sp.]